jgi:hypothetical protein
MTNSTQTTEAKANGSKQAAKAKKPGAPKGAKVVKVDGARQTVKPAPAKTEKLARKHARPVAAKGNAKPAKPAKAKNAKPAPAKRNGPPKGPQTLGEWGVMVGSNQERLLAILRQHFGKPVPLATVLAHVYGAKDAKAKAGAIQMVIGGLRAKAQANGHDIERGRDDAGPTLALVKAAKGK